MLILKQFLHFEDLIAFLACSGLDAVYIDGVLIEKAGNESALAVLANYLGNRQDYLDARKQRYFEWIDKSGSTRTYTDFSEFFEFLFDESVQSPVADAI